MCMKVNSAKTLLMCISDSRTYGAAAFIEDTQGVRVDSISSMEILGVHNVSAQVASICKKMRSRTWMLHHLHHNCFDEDELLKIYRSCILPCHDYCSNVYHSCLTLSQTVILEWL